MTQLYIPDPVCVETASPTHYVVLVYGGIGSGKTEFGASWSDVGPVLFIDADDGWLTIKSSTRIKHKDIIYRVPLIDRSPDKHITQPIAFLSAKGVLEQIYSTGSFGNVKPTTVIIDSLTTVSGFCMNYVLYINKHQGQQPTLPDYGRQMRELEDFIKLGKSLACNFICLAHEQFDKDELSGRTWCLPLVTGKLAGSMGLYFDEVYHSRVEQTGGKHSYVLDTKASGVVTAKSRLDLPAVIPATYASIKGTIETLSKGKEVQPTQTINPQQVIPITKL